MDFATMHGSSAGILPLRGGFRSSCRGRSTVGRSGRWCVSVAGRKAQFADQSHVAFYARPRKQRRSGTSSPRFAAAAAVASDSAAAKFELATVDDESVQEVIRQLEELQLKAKAKKQELKSINEMMKKKNEKKKKMEKVAVASVMKKRKKESSCSSSESSSESSCDDCGSSASTSRFDMAAMREELLAATSAAAATATATASPRSIIDAAVVETLSFSEASLEGGEKWKLVPGVEVCTGGKCRKAGSQQVLAAFQGKLPCSPATSSKCMGMCGQGPNVRIQRAGDGVPEIYNHVGVQDVDPLLQLLQIGRLTAAAAAAAAAATPRRKAC